jgi:hypothetical protein
MTKLRRMRWAGHVAQMGEECIQDIDGKTIRKETTRKTTCRWMDNIKMDLKETEWGGMDWIDLAQNRNQWRALMNMVMNLRDP